MVAHYPAKQDAIESADASTAPLSACTPAAVDPGMFVAGETIATTFLNLLSQPFGA